MARPKDPIYVWASQDVTLPVSGGPNKVKPIDDLLAKGYDKGQKPAAEEFNYILNMSSGWISWIVNEKFPELEAEINRLLYELETRINSQIASLRQDINQLKTDVADLRKYVDQRVSDLKQEIQGVRNDVTRLRQDLDSAITTLNGRIDALEPRLVPIGAVLPWPGTTVPPGWLECNGQVFNTSQNPVLASVLGRNVVPDYRGLFLRGWAHGSSANDPDGSRALGSIQGDAIRNIKGYAGGPAGGFEEGTVATGAFYLGPISKGAGGGHGDHGLGFDASLVVPTAPENRPVNIAVMYIIKTDQAQSSGSNSPTAIVVSPDTITNRVGYSTKATASVLPTSLAGQYPVSWSSQNTGVAVVDGQGNIQLVGPGETNIIASISTGMNVAIRVTSYSVLSSLAITDPGSIEVNQAKMLVVTKNPGDATEPLQFLSNNSGIATVNDSGYVTGVSPGSVTITARGTLSGVSTARQVTIVPEAVAQGIEDVRLGVEQQTPHNSDNYTDPIRAPGGCVLTGLKSAGLGLDTGYYKAIQKKVNGVWVTVEG